jgi:N-acetylneuraminic acid mutarotase
VIDPSIVVTSAGDFAIGNNEGDIAINTTNNSISTGGLTGGSISAGWTATTSIPTAVEWNTSVAYNGYVYEIGGYTGSAGIAAVDYAPINANGTVGTWTATTSLPSVIRSATSVVYNGYVYEIGGYNDSTSGALNTVYYAPINANGTLSAWTATTSLPTAINSASSVAYNGYVYVIGGSDNGTNLASVDYAPINANGTLSAWTATTSLPTAINSASSVAYNGYVYVIGGYTTAGIAAVDYAPINANGTIGTWTATTSLPAPTFDAISIVYNGYVYEIGGASSGAVGYAPINANGTIGTWTATTSLPYATWNAASIVYNGYLYEIGGCINSCAITADVDYAPIDPAGVVSGWTGTTGLPTGVNSASSVAYNGYVYEIGGNVNLSGSQSFGFTGGTQSYTVPAGVNSINVTLYGGAGGYSTTSYNGAPGGETTGTLSVTPGNTLTVIVAGAGGNGGSSSTGGGGYGGGGTGSGPYGANYGGGGGGGASQILNGSTELAIAGGGGGGTYNGAANNTGYGGGTYGGSGSVSYGTAAGGGGQSGGGAGATYGGYSGSAGGSLTGGAGGTGSTSGSEGGGGGGGGYWGGGGGEGSGYDAGGGGSSLVPSGGTTTSGVQSGNGSVTISYSISTTSAVEYAPINANGTLGTWTATTNLPTTLQNLGTVAYNGYLYVMGGYNGSGYINTVDYAPINANGALGSWTATTSFLTTRGGLGAVAYNGYLYIMGGWSGSAYLNDVQYALICTATNSGTGGCTGTVGAVGSWTATTSFPTARQDFGNVVYGGYLYVISGSDYTGDVQYAPINANGTVGSWTTNGTSFTTGRQGLSAIADNGYLYIMGGQNASANQLNDVQYAPINANGSIGSWAYSSSFTTVRAYFGAIADNGYVYIMGGYNNSNGYLNDVQVAQINNGGPGTLSGWTSTTSFSTGIYNPVSVAYNGYLYVMGGSTYQTSGSFLNSVQYAPINANGTIGSWNITSGFNTGRTDFGGVAYNGYVYVFGGSNGTELNDVQYAPINANGTIGAWAATTSFPTARSAFGSVVYNGYLYILGGYVASGSYLNDVQYAPINANGTIGAWAATTSFNTARYHLISVAYNGYLYVMGGVSTNGFNDVQYAPINANGTIGTWAATTSFNQPTWSFGTVAYNGYLYMMGGYDGSTSGQVATVAYAPINTDGTIGGWVTITSFAGAREGVPAVAYNGYLYIMGGWNTSVDLNDVQVTGLQSIPRIGQYSRLVDLTSSSTNDPTPIELLTNGTNTGNPGIGGGLSGIGTGGITVNYSFASNACSTLLTPKPFSTGVSNQLGTPFKFTFTTNGCGTATNIGRYVWVRYTIDDSRTASFPDTNGNHTTINDFTVYYHPASGNRLRGGATFSNGSLQTLDAPP